MNAHARTVTVVQRLLGDERASNDGGGWKPGKFSACAARRKRARAVMAEHGDLIDDGHIVSGADVDYLSDAIEWGLVGEKQATLDRLQKKHAETKAGAP